MKKMIGVLVALMCWMLCVLPVKADVIWEPYNDSFYTDHRESCERINRNYTADGPENKVLVYKSPENPVVVETWENGYTANIYYTWTDENGNIWGMYNNWETDETGWVPMEYMNVVYDKISFEEEFEESIVEESGVIPGEYVGMSIYFWSYPGAENCVDVVMPEHKENLPQYHKIFVDEEGRKWGCIGYYHGIRGMWICLDSASADVGTLYPEGLPARGAQMVDKDNFTEDTERIAPPTGGGAIGLIICLVLGVCGATGGALAGMKKKKG